MKNDTSFSHIYSEVHSLNSWWGLSWMWEKGAQFLHAPGVPKNFPFPKYSGAHKKKKKKKCFGLGFLVLFPSLKTKNLSLSDGNREQKICVFKSWKLSFSGNLVNSGTLWDPFAVNYQIIFSHLILPLHLLHSVHFFPQIFSITLPSFPLPSLRLLSHFVYTSFPTAFEMMNRSTEPA